MCALTLTATFAHANIGELAGFGARSAALGGASSAWNFEGFAAYSNPAALALRSEQRLRFSYALVYVKPLFGGINNIVVGNKFNSDSSSADTYANVANDYRDTFGQAIGLSYQFFPYLMNLSLGIVGFLPISQATYMDTGEALIPEFPLYRSRTQRPQIDFGFGINPYGPIYLGAGMHIGFTLNSRASLFIQSLTDTGSSMRFSSSLIPKAVPFFSAMFAPDGDRSVFTVSATYRWALASENYMTLLTSARSFGALAALDFNFLAFGTLFYDPAVIELGGSWQHASWGRATAQLEYVFWSAYQSPPLSVTNPVVTNGPAIQPSNNPVPTTVNLLVPRVGYELTLGRHSVRAGYSFKGSIYKDIPNGSGNLLDPPRHSANLGWGYQFERFMGTTIPFRVDAYATFGILVPQTITKTGTTNESGVTVDNKIGAPGYTASGFLVGGGASISIAL